MSSLLCLIEHRQMISKKRIFKRKPSNKKVSFDYETVWTLPKLLKYIKNSTITDISRIYAYSETFGEYSDKSKNKKILIGYSITINIGLYSTKLLCIHRFLKRWEKSNNFNRLLNSYMEKTPRVCIISHHSKSWGRKKEEQAIPVFLDWIRSSKKMLLSMGIKISTAPTVYIK